MSLQFIKLNHTKHIESLPANSVNIAISQPIGFGLNGCDTTCTEARDSNLSGVQESNRVSKSIGVSPRNIAAIQKYLRPTLQLHLLLICMLVLCAGNAYGQMELYVGEHWHIGPSVSGRIDAIAFYSDHPNDISISENNNSANIVITQYFSDTAIIECQYGYTYYIGGTKYHDTGHDYYYVKCKKSVVTLNKSIIEIAPGEEIMLSYSNSSGYKLPHCQWETDNRDIATVDDYYKSFEQEVTIKGIKPGKCTIKLYALTGNGNPECNVVVRDISLKSFSLSPTQLNIMVGKTSYFNVNKVPTNATTKITWKSSDESIATVSDTGIIKGIKEGKAKITATSENGISASGEVEIVGLPKSISLKSKYEINVEYGQYIELEFTPLGSSDTYSVKIEDPSIVEKRTNDYFVAKKIGKTKVTFTTKGGLIAETTIIVNPIDERYNHTKVYDRIKKVRNLFDNTTKILKK